MTSQPESMNVRASQSSSSGCEGSWPWLPKSSGVATIPRPKSDCHQRLTVTRAVSGCFGSVTHRARPSRLRGQSLARTATGPPACPARPARAGASYAPRRRTNVGRGCGSSFITMISATGSTRRAPLLPQILERREPVRYSASTVGQVIGEQVAAAARRGEPSGSRDKRLGERRCRREAGRPRAASAPGRRPRSRRPGRS